LRSIKVSVAKREIKRWKELKPPILEKITDANRPLGPQPAAMGRAGDSLG